MQTSPLIFKIGYTYKPVRVEGAPRTLALLSNDPELQEKYAFITGLALTFDIALACSSQWVPLAALHSAAFGGLRRHGRLASRFAYQHLSSGMHQHHKHGQSLSMYLEGMQITLATSNARRELPVLCCLCSIQVLCARNAVKCIVWI